MNGGGWTIDIFSVAWEMWRKYIYIFAILSLRANFSGLLSPRECDMAADDLGD